MIKTVGEGWLLEVTVVASILLILAVIQVLRSGQSPSESSSNNSANWTYMDRANDLEGIY